MQFLDYVDSWEQNLLFEKREEIFRRLRRTPPPAPSSMDDAIRHEDQARIVGVTIGEDGTPLTWIHTLKEPIRGYHHPDAVNLTAIYKRLIFQVIDSISKQRGLKGLMTVFGLLKTSHLLDDWFEYLFIMYPVLPKEEHFCPPVKEVRRVLRGKIKDNLLEAISLVIECDSAYKYRLQDILPELDQRKLGGYFPTLKELSRLIDILKERDVAQEGQPKKYEKIKEVLKLLLLIPSFRKKTTEVLKALDLEKVKLSREDICFTNTYTVYKIGGRDWEERKQENINNGNRLFNK
jgi:hypothetical protein